jgi:hypothetical protein
MSNGKNRLVKVNTAVNGFLNLSYYFSARSFISKLQKIKLLFIPEKIAGKTFPKFYT